MYAGCLSVAVTVAAHVTPTRTRRGTHSVVKQLTADVWIRGDLSVEDLCCDGEHVRVDEAEGEQVRPPGARDDQVEQLGRKTEQRLLGPDPLLGCGRLELLLVGRYRADEGREVSIVGGADASDSSGRPRP